MQFAKKRQQRILSCGSTQLEIGKRTIIMGIINVTTDSFSDGGRFFNVDAALEHAYKLVEDGADILDVGGESTRPGYTPLTAEEELGRVLPVIKALAKHMTVPIAIDTSKAAVAKAVIEAGAHIVNDVWGFKKDPEMAPLCASLNVPVILMHNRLEPLESQVMDGLIQETMECVNIALKAGVKKENIILDPGIGFGKTYDGNLTVLKNLSQFCDLEYPVLLGTSRKSVIGYTLNLPPNERVEGTGVTVCLGIAQGAEIIRVHDVKEMKRVAVMTDALVR